MPRPLTTADHALLARLAEGDPGLFLYDLSGNGRRMRDVRDHLRTLERAGLVSGEGPSGPIYWTLTKRGRALVEKDER